VPRYDDLKNPASLVRNSAACTRVNLNMVGFWRRRPRGTPLGAWPGVRQTCSDGSSVSMEHVPGDFDHWCFHLFRAFGWPSISIPFFSHHAHPSLQRLHWPRQKLDPTMLLIIKHDFFRLKISHTLTVDDCAFFYPSADVNNSDTRSLPFFNHWALFMFLINSYL
jgi:hypothetical protein